MPSHGAEARAASASRWPVAAALAGPMLVLCGCAGVMPRPAPRPTAEVPATWSADALAGPAGAAAQAPWWMRFNDALLARFVAEALQANTSVGSAQ
ncbi:MAG: hypothetical protein H7306_16275, partial [Bacteriovorax sp.]|nr:hypothetical protein [Rhizobacter sp.]